MMDYFQLWSHSGKLEKLARKKRLVRAKKPSGEAPESEQVSETWDVFFRQIVSKSKDKVRII